MREKEKCLSGRPKERDHRLVSNIRFLPYRKWAFSSFHSLRSCYRELSSPLSPPSSQPKNPSYSHSIFSRFLGRRNRSSHMMHHPFSLCFSNFCGFPGERGNRLRNEIPLVIPCFYYHTPFFYFPNSLSIECMWNRLLSGNSFIFFVAIELSMWIFCRAEGKGDGGEKRLFLLFWTVPTGRGDLNGWSASAAETGCTHFGFTGGKNICAKCWVSHFEIYFLLLLLFLALIRANESRRWCKVGGDAQSIFSPYTHFTHLCLPEEKIKGARAMFIRGGELFFSFCSRKRCAGPTQFSKRVGLKFSSLPSRIAHKTTPWN